MKKVLAFLAIMLLPLSVMAMTPVSDNALGNVTGQAGVSINVDVTMNLDIDVAAWGDSDGFTGAATQGWVGVTTLQVSYLHIWPRTDYNPHLVSGADPSNYRLLTIDVGTDSAGTTKVQIGMPTLTITMASMTANVKLGSDPSALDQLMGTLYVGDLNMATDGYDGTNGYLYIYAHDNCGVDIDFKGVTIAYLNIGKVAWGDTDGLAGGYGDTCGTLAGYVGLSSLNITTIKLDGGISIDVGTNDTNDTNCSYNVVPDHGNTFVIIGIKNNTSVYVGSLTAAVELGSSNALGEKLGDIYVKGMTATIIDNPLSSTRSFVHIFAH